MTTVRAANRTTEMRRGIKQNSLYGSVMGCGFRDARSLPAEISFLEFTESQ